MKLRPITWILAVSLAFASAHAEAEIFRYLDQRGGTVFTDHPLADSRYKLVWRSSTGDVTEPVRAAVAEKRPPPRWAKKPEYAPLISRVAQKVKLSPELIHAVVQAESAYNPGAVSSAGAMGLMQLMPATARRYGVADVWDPRQNLEAGATYLRDLLDMFQNNLKLALAAYNAGEGAVRKYGNRIPPYPETQSYVRKVVGFYLIERRKKPS